MTKHTRKKAESPPDHKRPGQGAKPYLTRIIEAILPKGLKWEWAEAGWRHGGNDRVLHWYYERGEGRWGTLCGKRLLFIKGPGEVNNQFHRKCKTCSKKLARIEYEYEGRS